MMKSIYTKKIRLFLSIPLLAILIASCGSYQNASDYNEDPIYRKSSSPYTKKKKKEVEETAAVQYKNYFELKSDEYAAILGQEDSIFTDIEDYSSTYVDSTDVVTEYSNQYISGNPGFGENPQGISSVTVINTGFGFGGFGFNRFGFGFNRFGFGGFGPFGFGGFGFGGFGGFGFAGSPFFYSPFYSPFYGGFGFGRFGFGFNRFGFGFNRFGFVGGRSGIAFVNSRRGAVSNPNVTSVRTAANARGFRGRSSIASNGTRNSIRRSNASLAARRGFRSTRNARSRVNRSSAASRVGRSGFINSARNTRTPGFRSRSTTTGSRRFISPRSSIRSRSGSSTRSIGRSRSSFSRSRSSGGTRSFSRSRSSFRGSSRSTGSRGRRN